MARLIYIKEINNTNLLRLGITEGEENAAYTVSSTLYSELGRPTRGSLLSEESMDEIRAADGYYKAKKKALSLLSYTDNNRRTLISKLRSKGVKGELAEDVAREMVSLGYIDECRQLERIILSEANVKLYGAGKIIPKLAAKGYSSTDIRRVMGELVDSGEVDFSKNAKLLLNKKMPDNATSDEKKKLLYKYGYKISSID